MTAAPTLLMVVGAPAVGKMTVGREIAARTGFRLFHNHASIEPILPVFGFGHPSFIRLVEGLRRNVLSEVAASDLPGLVFTFAWAFGQPGEQESVDEYTAPFRERGSRVLFLELTASLDTRLERNQNPHRLREKPSKRDLDASRQVMLDHEARYRFTSDGEMDGRDDWLSIDNTSLTPAQVAAMAIEHFALPSLQTARATNAASSTTRVRACKPDDAVAVAEIYNHYVAESVITFEEEPVTTERMAGRIEEVVGAGFPWLVAEGESGIAGFAYGAPWKRRSAYRYAAEITAYLHPEARGKGVGTALYGKLFPTLEEQGMHVVVAVIALPNPASVALHERFGMRQVAYFEEVGFKHGAWIDVGYWSKRLGGRRA